MYFVREIPVRPRRTVPNAVSERADRIAEPSTDAVIKFRDVSRALATLPCGPCDKPRCTAHISSARARMKLAYAYGFETLANGISAILLRSSRAPLKSISSFKSVTFFVAACIRDIKPLNSWLRPSICLLPKTESFLPTGFSRMALISSAICSIRATGFCIFGSI